MLVTVWTRQGRKSIHLPLEALDKVREMVYNNSEHIIEYSVCVCDYERNLIMELYQKDNRNRRTDRTIT